jgi:TonB family protein
MMQPRHLLFLLCALSLLHPTTGTAADGTLDISAGGIQLPQRDKLDIIWPGFIDREALVRVRFVVHADGHVSEIELLEGGFHEKRFVDEVFRALKKAKFKPAMKDGVPIDNYCVVLPVNFTVGEMGKGVTPEFRRELDKVEKLILSGDNAGAHFHAEWMLSDKAKLLYEYAALQAQLAYTHANVGNIHRAITAAHAGSQRKSPVVREFNLDEMAPPNSASHYMLPREVVTKLLELRFRLAARKGMLLEAIQAYQELAGLVPIAADDPRAEVARLIVAALKGDKPLEAQLRIDETRVAEYEMFRRTFSIVPRTGRIDEIHVRCAGKSRELVYKEGVEWTVPASWERCSIFVRGEVDTEFDLMEYTRATAATAQPEG